MPIGAHIAKIFAKKDIPVVVSNHEVKDVVRSEWLLNNAITEPLATTVNSFDKPRSKYHK